MEGGRRSQRDSPTCVNARPENTPHPVGRPVIVEDEACEWHLTGVLQSSIRLTATRVSTEPASPACSTDLDGIPHPKQDASPHADRPVNGRKREDWEGTLRHFLRPKIVIADVIVSLGFG